ncbi:helix-turn-helix transcriptional regulator [Umezawaea sp.]|uniref:helix-turn-helix transcriptional regulator n=1 Tax=Umezawaea sp. TaxID=1955258 RepID=UPI002ED0F085
MNSGNDHGQDWQRLVLSLLDVRDGRGSVVLLEGPPGIGRSRMIADALAVAAEQGIRTCSAQADELTRWTPLAPVVSALGETIWALAGSPMKLAAQLLGKIEERAAAGPLVIALDDLQWADQITLAAVQSFVAHFRNSPVVWLLACRDGAGEAITVGRLFDRLTALGATRLRLEPLPDDAVARIVTDHFAAPPGDDLAELAAGARGNPALLTELLDGLRAEDAVEVGESGARLTTRRLPRHLTSAVRTRLEGFSTDTIGVLEIAAILGRSFRLADVAEVLGRTSADVLRGIREVLRVGLLDCDEHADTLSFSHDLVWRAVHETIAAPVAAALHRQVGQMLLQRNNSDPKATAHLVSALEEEMARYETAGATGDVARVRSELRALGVRRKHWTHAERSATGWDSLTETERQVTDLVAEGLTNRQIAARMFVSPHTVHAHLGRIFRKLAVNSRVELTGLRYRVA